MESLPRDPYERQLLEVFKSCDCQGSGLLDKEGLSRLCELLHLDEGREQLMSCLLTNSNNPQENLVSFSKFRDALLKLLDGSPGSPEKREPSPAREVSPKYVYGEKKYGRRSRPESTEQQGEDSESEDPLHHSHLPKNEFNNLLSSQKILLSERRDFSIGGCGGEEGCSSDEEGRKDETVVGLSPSADLPPDFLSPSLDKESARLCERELREAWERLGVGVGGCLTRSELATICAAVGMDSLADQVVSQVFSSLKADEEGRICFDEFLDLFRSRIEETSSPQYSQYEKSPNIMDLCDFSNSSHRRLFHELQAMKLELEAVSEERDKLKSDLADANRRSTLLAQEIDERHARIEAQAALTLELLEAKHTEEVKSLREQLSREKEQLIGSNMKLEESLASHVEQLSRAIQDIDSLRRENESLEKENRELSGKMTEREMRLRECQEQLDCMAALHQRVVELEYSNEKVASLQERLTLLGTENAELRDRNDELTSQIESLISRSTRRREGSWSSLELTTSAGAAATKRRGVASPEPAGPESRLGKVRRCSTETDLTLHASSDQCLRLQKLETSESGLEEDLSTLRASPAHSFDIDSDWEPSTTSEQVEGLKSYIAELEAKLERFQTQGWQSKASWKEGQPLDLDEISLHSSSGEVDGTAEDPLHHQSAGSHHPPPASTSSSSRRRSQEGEEEEAEGSRPRCEVGVQTSGQHCHQVEEELEVVRAKIVEVLTEKKACSQEVCALKLQLEQLMRALSSQPPPVSSTMNCLRCTSSEVAKKATLEALKEENLTLANRCAELENSLEMLRLEYEKTEDYWENKLDEERRLFEFDKEQSDEKFLELEAKITEYAEMVASDQAKKVSLPPIEEKDFLEKQFTDLEEEYDAYRQSVEEELVSKDLEISELREALIKYQSSEPIKQDAQTQTDPPNKTGVRPKTIPTPSSSKANQEGGSRTGGAGGRGGGEVCCSRSRGGGVAAAAGGSVRDKLRAEVEALTQRKQLLMGQISSLQAQSHQALSGGGGGGRLSASSNGVGSSSSSSLTVFQSLSNRLRHQEIRCRELQAALRSQQRETETILQKAWERHKIDLTTIQNSLRVTQEKLQMQKKNTKQQLERLATADSLVKDLFTENAHLVQTVVTLEHKFHSLSESALHNSF